MTFRVVRDARGLGIWKNREAESRQRGLCTQDVQY